jgi:site-specific DNA-methyltransferase (cytosine-N4-specific)
VTSISFPWGKRINQIVELGCDSLDSAIRSVEEVSRSRGIDVASFYLDLRESIANVSKKIRKGGYCCYVVADRKVKGTTLPTHEAVRCFFEQNGLVWLNTFTRSIPNKRMPAKNSPTNVVGHKEETMTKEYIVIMGK